MNRASRSMSATSSTGLSAETRHSLCTPYGRLPRNAALSRIHPTNRSGRRWCCVRERPTTVVVSIVSRSTSRDVPMNRLTDIRLQRAATLVAPQFDDPAELIRWMGMVQAQEYSSAKWAVALAAHARSGARGGGVARRSHPAYAHHAADVAFHRGGGRAVDAAPVGTADPRRQCVVCQRQRLRLDEEDYLRCSRLLERDTRRGQPPHAAADRRGAGTSRNGRRRTAVESSDDARRKRTAWFAAVPTGREKPTYALLAERVPQAVDLPEEEALAPAGASLFPQPFSGDVRRFRLVSRGCPSGRPAAVSGRWTGSCCANRSAGGSICCTRVGRPAEKAPAHAHLLPAFDEYLIAYKDRSDVLAPEHRARAFNDFRCFPAGAARRPDRGGSGAAKERRSAWSRSPVKTTLRATPAVGGGTLETVPRGTGVFVRALQFVRQRRGHDLRGVEIAPALGDRVERGHQRGNVGQRDELQTGLFEIGQPL